MAPPREFDRTMTLTVADRQVVAHDQHVVALTLASRRRPCRAGTAARGSHLTSTYPAGWSASTRSAATPTSPTLPDRGAADPRRRWGVHRGARRSHVGSTVTTSGPRNAFPLTVPGYGSPSRRFRFIAAVSVSRRSCRCCAWRERLRRRVVDDLRRPQPRQPAVHRRARRFGDRIEIRTDDEAGDSDRRELLGECLDDTAVYACGPAPMLTAIRAELAGRDDVELHFERFAAPPVLDGTEFEVTVASSGDNGAGRRRRDAAGGAAARQA